MVYWYRCHTAWDEVGMKLLRKCILAAFASLLGLASPAFAKVIDVEFRWPGDQPDEIDLGLAGNLPKMNYNSATKTYRAQVDITAVNPVPYSLVFRFGDDQYQIDLVMFEAHPNINLGISHSVPHECRESQVVEASTPADNNNIPQALSRYLLAAQLIAIRDQAHRCRDSQPRRLEKARLERAIQLGTFRGSPFRPTFGDQSKFAQVLGAPVASVYAKQLQANLVTNLHMAVRDGILSADSPDKVAASKELNDYLVADINKDEQRRSTYRDAGINATVLEGNNVALERITS